LVRHVSGERRGRRPPPAQPHAQRQPLAPPGIDRSGLGSGPRQGQLPDGPVSSPGRQTGQETGAAGGRTFAAGDRVPSPETRRGVPRFGTELLRPAGTRASAALPGQASTSAGLRSDAVATESRRPRRLSRVQTRRSETRASAAGRSPYAPPLLALH